MELLNSIYWLAFYDQLCHASVILFHPAAEAVFYTLLQTYKIGAGEDEFNKMTSDERVAKCDKLIKARFYAWEELENDYSRNYAVSTKWEKISPKLNYQQISPKYNSQPLKIQKLNEYKKELGNNLELTTVTKRINGMSINEITPGFRRMLCLEEAETEWYLSHGSKENLHFLSCRKKGDGPLQVVGYVYTESPSLTNQEEIEEDLFYNQHWQIPHYTHTYYDHAMVRNTQPYYQSLVRNIPPYNGLSSLLKFHVCAMAHSFIVENGLLKISPSKENELVRWFHSPRYNDCHRGQVPLKWKEQTSMVNIEVLSCVFNGKKPSKAKYFVKIGKMSQNDTTLSILTPIKNEQKEHRGESSDDETDRDNESDGHPYKIIAHIRFDMYNTVEKIFKI